VLIFVVKLGMKLRRASGTVTKHKNSFIAEGLSFPAVGGELFLSHFLIRISNILDIDMDIGYQSGSMLPVYYSVVPLSSHLFRVVHS
jgi:hypothetical protein